MKVLSFIPRNDLQRRVAKALGSAQFLVETAASAKETLEFAKLAPYGAVLVDSDSLIFGDIVLLVNLLRQENPETSIFVFVRYLDLGQLLQLFEAGADDCVRESLFRLRACSATRVVYQVTPSSLRSGGAQYLKLTQFRWP
jgi:DNA-binding response OmpR family regulator